MPAFLLTALLKPSTWAWIGVAALLAFGGVQSLRLANAKHDEAVAKAAQIDPATKIKWQTEEVADHASLLTCQTNEITLRSGIDQQNAAETAKSRADAAALARAEQAIRNAQAGQSSAVALLKAIQGKIAGTNAADRCANFDQTFVNTLKGPIK